MNSYKCGINSYNIGTNLYHICMNSYIDNYFFKTLISLEWNIQMKKFFQFYNLFIELEFSPFEFSAKIQKIILQLGMNSCNIDTNLYHICMNLYNIGTNSY